MAVLQTPRLLLRPLVLEDAEPLQVVFGDPAVMQFGDGVRDLAWIREWIKTVIRTQYPIGLGVLAVTIIPDPIPIGFCGLSFYPSISPGGQFEVGFRLGQHYWGQGYATEAATAILRKTFTETKIEKLACLIDPNNWRSIRVAEKLGMSLEREVMLPGYTHPDILFAISRSQYLAQD